MVLAVIGTAAAAAAYLVPPGVFFGYDYVQFHSPHAQYWAAAVRELRLPLWNPHVGLGRPFAADIQTSTFYPATVLFLLGPGLGLALSVLAHLLLAAAGMRLLGRRLGLPALAADGCALVVLASGPLAGRFLVGHLGIAEGLCYLPLALALAHRLQDQPSSRALAWLALALALQLLTGHPQAAWTTWLTLALFLAGRRLHALPRGWPRQLLRDLGLFAAAIAWAAGMAAVVLLPFAELTAQGNRAIDSRVFASAGALPWRFLGTLFLAPDPKLAAALGPEPTFYPGVLVALAGLAGALTIRRRDVTGFALVVAGCLLLALGDRTPAFAVAYRLLPGLSGFRLPLRSLLPVPFVLIPLAALFLCDERPGRLHRRALVAITAVAAGLSGWLWWAVPRSTGPDLAGLGARLVLLLAAFVLLLAWTAAGTGRRRWLLAGIAATVVLDLALPVHAWRSVFQVQPPPGEAAIAQLLARPPLLQQSGAPPRVLVPHFVARYDAGMTLGFSTPAGYVVPGLERVWATVHGTLGIEPPLNNTFPSPRIFERPFPYDGMALALGYDPARRQLALRSDPDPRAYTAGCVEAVPTWRDAVRRVAAGHDLHDCALVEQEYAGLVSGRLTAGSARLVSFAPERVVVRTESAGATLLVLSEAWYPGWRATVGGREVPTLPVNAWMRAALVPAGSQEVVFSYRSRLLGAGASLSLLSLFGLLAALRRRDRVQ